MISPKINMKLHRFIFSKISMSTNETYKTFYNHHKNIYNITLGPQII